MKRRSFVWCGRVVIAILLLVLVFGGSVPFGLEAAPNPAPGAVTKAAAARLWVYDLPLIMDRAYGGFTTGISIRNNSPLNPPRTVRIDYYKDGALLAEDQKELDPGAYWGVYLGGRFGPGFVGQAYILSFHPLSVEANATGPAGVAFAYAGENVETPYAAFAAPYLPLVADRSFGGFSTEFTVFGMGGSPMPVTVSYYDRQGGLIATDTATIPPLGHWTFTQRGRLGLGRTASAVIRSDQGISPVAVTALGPGGRAFSYCSFTGGGTTIDLPVVFNNGGGGYTSRVYIQNVTAGPANGSIKYYDRNGVIRGTQKINLPARGSISFGQDSAGLPLGFSGSAAITTDVPVAAVVTASGPGGVKTYKGAVATSGSVSVPFLSAGDFGGWTTAIIVQNALPTPQPVTIRHFDPDGVSLGEISRTIPGSGQWVVYQRGDAAYSGRVRSADIKANGPIAVVVNGFGPRGAALSYNGTYVFP